MLANERKQKILDFIKKKESVTVLELKNSLNVSEMTIRRDLGQLDDDGLIERVHGGAINTARVSNQRKSFKDREDKYQLEKQLIANFASSLIKDQDSIFFDSGTTLLELVKMLDWKHELFMMTFSLPIAAELAKYKNSDIYMPGGFIRDSKEMNLVGNSALEEINRFSVEKVFISAWGFHENRGLTYMDVEETTLREKIINSAKEVNVLIDSSKFGKDGRIAISNLSKVDRIITDEGIPDKYRELCLLKGIQVYIINENDFEAL